MVDKVAWLIVSAVVAVWATSTLALPFFIKGYVPPPEIGPVMGSLAGGAAAYLFAKRADGGRKDEKKDPPMPRRRPQPPRRRPKP